MQMHFHSRVRRGLTAVGTASLLLLPAACGGDDEPADASSDATRGAGTLIQTWPLTGLPVEGEAPDHPVMVVKIDNTTASQPQIGLGSADLVTEELVEGGLTRLAVFYHSQVPELVGPVRSMRATDVGITTPADAVLVASGGAPKTRKIFAQEQIRVLTEGAKGYERTSDRSAPYNLMMHLDELAASLKPGDPPPPYLPFGKPDLSKAKPAGSITVEFSAAQTTQFRYQGDTYARPGSNADPQDDFAADNVLVLRVRVGDAGYLDPAGNPVPVTFFTGKGEAMLFTDGKMVPGHWSKDGEADQLSLTTNSGDQLAIPPGRTWIELVPRDGGSVAFTK